MLNSRMIRKKELLLSRIIKYIYIYNCSNVNYIKIFNVMIIKNNFEYF